MEDDAGDAIVIDAQDVLSLFVTWSHVTLHRLVCISTVEQSFQAAIPQCLIDCPRSAVLTKTKLPVVGRCSCYATILCPKQARIITFLTAIVVGGVKLSATKNASLSSTEKKLVELSMASSLPTISVIYLEAYMGKSSSRNWYRSGEADGFTCPICNFWRKSGCMLTSESTGTPNLMHAIMARPWGCTMSTR